MAASDQIDYSPLAQPVTQADLIAYKSYISSLDSSKAKSGRSTYLLIGLIGVVVLWIMFASFIEFFQEGKIGGFFWLCFAAVFAWFTYKIWIENNKRLAKLYKFAKNNNIVLKISISNHGLNGVIFNQGSNRNVAEAFKFSNGSEIGNYQYTTGSGKNKTTQEWGYVLVPLVRNLPNMILDAKSNNLMGRLSNLPIALSKNAKLQLEGNFNNYFDLYVPEEYERDALYLFTPDVMAVLVDSGAAYDIEVIDNSLMIYRNLRFNLASEQELKQVFSIVNLIAGEIRDQSHSYKDDRTVSKAQNIVADPGKRLKNGFGKTASIVGATIFIVIFLFQAVVFIMFIMNML